MAKNLLAEKRQKRGKNLLANRKPKATDDDTFLESLDYGVDQAINNFGSTIGNAGGDVMRNLLSVESGGKEVFNLSDYLPDSWKSDAAWKQTGQGIADAYTGPKNYTPSKVVRDPDGSMFDTGNYDLSQLPKAIAEQVPNMGGALASGLLGPGGVLAYGAGQAYGPVVEERMRRLGVNNISELSQQDKEIAAVTALGAGGLEALGIKGSSKLASKALQKLATKGRTGKVAAEVTKRAGRVGAEGTTEAGQDVIEQFGSSVATPDGVDISGSQAVGAGLAGAGSRAVTTAPGGVVSTIDHLVGTQYKPKRLDAAKRVAGTMQDVQEQGNYNKNDLTPRQYANETSKMVVKGTYQKIAEGIKLYGNKLKPLIEKETPELADLDFDNILGIENPNTDKDNNAITDPLDPESQIVINTALRAGKNQHEGGISQDALDLIERKFGQFEEGRRLKELLEDAEEYKRFHDLYRKGPTGGVLGKFGNNRVSKFIKNRMIASAIGGATGTGLTLSYMAPQAASLSAMAFDPVTLSIVGGMGTSYVGGYALDKYTKRRSKVERFFKDFGEESGNRDPREHGVSVNDYMKYQDELSNVEASAERTQKEAIKAISEDLYRRAMANPQAISMDWLMENSDYLSRSDFNALYRRMQTNEREAAKVATNQSNAQRVQEATAAKEAKDALLKSLIDDWRGNRLSPSRLLEVRDQLTPAEYEKFTRQQLKDDQRVVKFGYDMAKQKSAEAEAVAANLENIAKRLDKENKKLEAASARERAQTARDKAAKDAKNAARILSNVESKLALKEHAATLTDTDVLENKDILGPAKMKTWLGIARRIEDKKIKDAARKAKKNIGLRVHRGTPKQSVDPLKDIGKKVSAINKIAKMRKDAMAQADRLAQAPRPSPVTRIEALGGDTPIVSDPLATPKPNRRSEGIGNEEKYWAKVEETQAMEDGIERQGEALLNTADHALGVAFVEFVRDIRNSAKNDIDFRHKVQQTIAQTLPEGRMRNEFIAETEELTQAFGRSLSELARIIQEAVDKYPQAKKSDIVDGILLPDEDVPF